jgi:putative hemolysin
MALNEEPSAFLSTIQVGITTIGILSGVVGEGLLAASIAEWLSRFEWIAPYAKGFSVALVVVIITYLSVVIGELVPKRLALLAPERIASVVARPMVWLAGITRPLVLALSSSSNLLLRLLGARRADEPPVTDDEIKVLMEQGAEAGVFHESEQAIVSNVLRLDDQRIGAIMTPRMDIYAIDLDEGEDVVRARIAESRTRGSWCAAAASSTSWACCASATCSSRCCAAIRSTSSPISRRRCSCRRRSAPRNCSRASARSACSSG